MVVSHFNMKLLTGLTDTLLPLYIRHEEPIYCHDHPTETDRFNACVKALKDALKNIEWPSVGVNQILTVDLQNIEETTPGNIVVKVDVLESPVSLGTLLLRDNGGVFEFSSDAGQTWTEIGAGGGGGVTDHTLLTNIGTNSHADIDTHIADTNKHIDWTNNTVHDFKSTMLVDLSEGTLWCPAQDENGDALGASGGLRFIQHSQTGEIKMQVSMAGNSYDLIIQAGA